MRSTFAALVLALTLGLVGVGQAADLAACTGTSSVNVNNLPDSFNHACTAPDFVLAATTTLTVSLSAESPFTGTLEGRLQRIGTGAGDGVHIFTADFVLGSASASTQDFEVAAGTWRLIVTAEFPSVGKYSGSVAPPAASPSPSPSESASESPAP